LLPRLWLERSVFQFFRVGNSGYFQAKSTFDCGGPMLAPAFVGVTLLSLAGFEICRSRLLSRGGSAVEGRPIPLLVATSQEVPWRRSVTNRNVRGPIGAPRPAVAPASINLDRRRAGLGVSVSGYRSKGRREAAHGAMHHVHGDGARRLRQCCILPGTCEAARLGDWKPARGMPEFNR
jgi:hypothetical protein